MNRSGPAVPAELTTFLRIPKRFPGVYSGLCVVALGASFALMLSEYRPVLIDYQVYRWAVETWLAGGDIASGGPTTSVGITLPWAYPPFALLPLSLIGLVPFGVGAALLYVIDLVALGGTLYLVTRHLWPQVGTREAVAVTGAVLPLTLFLEPVGATFGLGQINLALMGLVAADCLVKQPRWPRGLLIGLAAAVKLTPAVFLLFFLLRRDYRSAATLVVTAVVATGIGFVVDFPASVRYWFTQGPAAGVSGSPYLTNQSIMAGLARMELPPSQARILWVLLGTALVLAVALAIRRGPAPLAFVCIGLLGLVLSPTSWSDHWVWAAPGLLVMTGYALTYRSAGWSVLAALTAVVAVTAPFTMAAGGAWERWWTPWDHFLGSSYLVTGLALLGLFGLFGSRRARDRSFSGGSPAPPAA